MVGPFDPLINKLRQWVAIHTYLYISGKMEMHIFMIQPKLEKKLAHLFFFPHVGMG